MILFWHYRPSQHLWEFRNEDRSRIAAAVCDEFIWDARKEPGRSGLQRFFTDRGISPLPDRAFEFEEPV